MDSGAAALQIISRVFAPISAQYSHIMTNHSAVLRLISRSSPSEDIHTADKDATETISCIKIEYWESRWVGQWVMCCFNKRQKKYK